MKAWQIYGFVSAGIDLELFFVLSGFLIGGLLMTELNNYGLFDVPRFLVRSGLRPPHFGFSGYLMLMPSLKALLDGDDPWTTFCAGKGDIGATCFLCKTTSAASPLVPSGLCAGGQFLYDASHRSYGAQGGESSPGSRFAVPARRAGRSCRSSG
jgi:hypothetical protein